MSIVSAKYESLYNCIQCFLKLVLYLFLNIYVLYDPDKKTVVQLREIRIDGSEIRAVKNGNDATYIMSQVKVIFIFYLVSGFTDIHSNLNIFQNIFSSTHL